MTSGTSSQTRLNDESGVLESCSLHRIPMTIIFSTRHFHRQRDIIGHHKVTMGFFTCKIMFIQLIAESKYLL